jgi:peptidoglycan/xylan/chitin deacetylase (PgdA/CDA1 family)
MLLTFDDGFQSVLTHAAPVLRRYRVPAVLFVIAGTLEQSYVPWFVPFNRMVERAAPNSVTWRGQTWVTSHRPGLRDFCERFKDELYRSPAARHHALLLEVGAALGLSRESAGECFAWDVDDDMRFLTCAELRECAAYSIEIGAHSMTHADLGVTTGPMLADEIAGAKRQFERCGLAVRSFSYPDGRFSEAAIALARENYEITFAVKTPEGPANRHALPRIGLERERQRELWRKLQRPSPTLQWLEDRGLAVLRRVGVRPAKW